MHQLPAPAIERIRGALLEFFDTAARDLPWRNPDAGPYAVWVSEVMSQQTRIETVVPYYERWMRRFPDVQTLAGAPLDDVLREWQGLGYYSRARNLHSAASVVRERHDGIVPGTYDALRTLPGVGEYTAGAVSSIAFGERVPAVDGNVRRVIARLLDEPAPSAARVRSVAAALVPPDRPGDFNQALMELGATVCTPRAPRCDRCVIAQECAAHAAGTQLKRPQRNATRAVPVFDIATAVLRRDDGRVLLVRRPPKGLLAGLWSFPGRELAPDTAVADAAVVAAAITIAAGHGTVRSQPVAVCTIEHTFSHRRERYHCVRIDIDPHASAPDSTEAGSTAWVDDDAGAYALPRAQQRIHAAVFA